MSSSDTLLRVGGYELDPLRHVLLLGPREVQLTPIASRLLQLLAKRPDEVVERTDIITDLWRGDFLVGDPALSRVVSEIRAAVGDDKRRPTLIQTVPRRGYRLVTAPADPARIAVAKPSQWPLAWRMANVSLALLLGGFALLVGLAILARHYR
jgi:DNA-binding winged helix-turn-helix (wHTH) protein